MEAGGFLAIVVYFRIITWNLLFANIETSEGILLAGISILAIVGAMFLAVSRWGMSAQSMGVALMRVGYVLSFLSTASWSWKQKGHSFYSAIVLSSGELLFAMSLFLYFVKYVESVKKKD